VCVCGQVSLAIVGYARWQGGKMSRLAKGVTKIVTKQKITV